MEDFIDLNRRIHDFFAEEYDKRHVEIYNPTEQDRVKAMITECKESFVNISSPKALDFGAGTGNLTKHMLDLGFEVEASDISEKSLINLKKKFRDHQERLSTSLINGSDLNIYADKTFDFVGTYSVLHHVPDYLRIVEEMVRVTKIGGLIYIDHEVCPDYWNQSTDYESYRKELEPKRDFTFYAKKIRRASSLSAWRRLWYRNVLRNRINEEGDIHVFPDDHIEWDRIDKKLVGCSIVKREDYLVCREMNPIIWRKWRDKCADMRAMVIRRFE